MCVCVWLSSHQNPFRSLLSAFKRSKNVLQGGAFHQNLVDWSCVGLFTRTHRIILVVRAWLQQPVALCGAPHLLHKKKTGTDTHARSSRHNPDDERSSRFHALPLDQFSLVNWLRMVSASEISQPTRKRTRTRTHQQMESGA